MFRGYSNTEYRISSILLVKLPIIMPKVGYFMIAGLIFHPEGFGNGGQAVHRRCGSTNCVSRPRFAGEDIFHAAYGAGHAF